VLQGGGDGRVNVLLLIGTRPEAIKMFPLVHALRESAVVAPVVVTTGQHRDLVEPILRLAGVVPDHDLAVGHPGLTLNELVAGVVAGLDAFCRERFGAEGGAVATRAQLVESGFPGSCLVHGDTSSALAAALAAFNLRIPVTHVEAGLRTRSTLSPFPEELNRQLIARIASFHLAPTTTNEENLVRERVPDDQVFVTGNTGIDALRYAAGLPDVEFDDDRVEAAIAGEAPLVVVTAHRRENWDRGLAGIATAVTRLAAAHEETRFVVPLHPNPLVRERLGRPLEGLPNVLLCEPLDYAPFAKLLARATLVLTDSGGIQEEAPALGVPVLVLRDTTERGEGVDAGTLRLVGTDPAAVVEAADPLLRDPVERTRLANVENPYGDGHAAQRIVAAIEWVAGAGPPPQPFGPGFSRQKVLAAAGYRGSVFAGYAADPARAAQVAAALVGNPAHEELAR
jgi:UDP-N-acetylglucosamine 2-epimerase (non-hydrolysing)